MFNKVNKEAVSFASPAGFGFSVAVPSGKRDIEEAPGLATGNRGRDECRGGRFSQGNRFLQYAIPYEWMKRILFSDIYSTAQFLFQIDQQPSLNEEIDIAVLAGGTPSERAEHMHTLNAVLGCDGEDRGAFVLAQVIKGRAFPFSHRPR